MSDVFQERDHLARPIVSSRPRTGNVPYGVSFSEYKVTGA